MLKQRLETHRFHSTSHATARHRSEAEAAQWLVRKELGVDVCEIPDFLAVEGDWPVGLRGVVARDQCLKVVESVEDFGVSRGDGNELESVKSGLKRKDWEYD